MSWWILNHQKSINEINTDLIKLNLKLILVNELEKRIQELESIILNKAENK